MFKQVQFNNNTISEAQIRKHSNLLHFVTYLKILVAGNPFSYVDFQSIAGQYHCRRHAPERVNEGTRGGRAIERHEIKLLRLLYKYNNTIQSLRHSSFGFLFRNVLSTFHLCIVEKFFKNTIMDKSEHVYNWQRSTVLNCRN